MWLSGKPSTAVFVAALAIAGLVACGQTDPGGDTNEGGRPTGTAASGGAEVTVSRDNPCSVMFPSEVEEILGKSSEMREIVDEVTCHYDFEEPDPSSEDERFIEVKVHWTSGQEVLMANRLASNLLGGESGGAFESISGIGDEAWLAPLASYLAFVKGDVGVEIDMRMLPGERETALRLARLIASRL